MLKMVDPFGTSPAHERQRQAPNRVLYDVHRRSPRLPVTVTYPLITYPLPIRYRWTAFCRLLRYFNDSAVEDLVLNYLSPAAFAVRVGHLLQEVFEPEVSGSNRIGRNIKKLRVGLDPVTTQVMPDFVFDACIDTSTKEPREDLGQSWIYVPRRLLPR